MCLLGGGGGGAYARDKNTSVRVCAKNAGGAYARGGAYLWDTTVIIIIIIKIIMTVCRQLRSHPHQFGINITQYIEFNFYQ